MNIDILRTFLSVARTRSFTKAAEENFCTQSTASVRVKSLEDHFDLKLFDRIGKAVYLTNDGQQLLPHIELVVDSYEQTGELVLQLKKLSHGKISIISSNTPGNYLIPKILVDFHRRYPDIAICSQIAYARDVIKQIDKTNRFDLGVISQPEKMIEKYRLMTIEIREFSEDPLAIIVNHKHPWTEKGAIELSDLMEKSIFLSNQETSLLAYLNDLTGLKISEKKRVITGSLEAVKKAVRFSDGFSILSGLAVREDLCDGGLTEVKLKDYDLRRKIYLVSKKNKMFSSAMKSFLNDMTQWIEDSNCCKDFR